MAPSCLENSASASAEWPSRFQCASFDGLPDAVQVRLAADALRPAALLREHGLRENGQGQDAND